MLSGILLPDNEWGGDSIALIQGPVVNMRIETDRIKIGVEIVYKEGVEDLTADGFIHPIGCQVGDAWTERKSIVFLGLRIEPENGDFNQFTVLHLIIGNDQVVVVGRTGIERRKGIIAVKPDVAVAIFKAEMQNAPVVYFQVGIEYPGETHIFDPWRIGEFFNLFTGAGYSHQYDDKK